MAEAGKYIDKDSDTGKELHGFIKKFTKLKSGKAEEMKKKLLALELMKLKDDGISKVIDLLPETNEELNKIFNDIGLNEDETNKILNIVKEFQ